MWTNCGHPRCQHPVRAICWRNSAGQWVSTPSLHTVPSGSSRHPQGREVGMSGVGRTSRPKRRSKGAAPDRQHILRGSTRCPPIPFLCPLRLLAAKETRSGASAHEIFAARRRKRLKMEGAISRAPGTDRQTASRCRRRVTNRRSSRADSRARRAAHVTVLDFGPAFAVAALREGMVVLPSPVDPPVVAGRSSCVPRRALVQHRKDGGQAN